jgi:hypothetical protein
MGDPSWTYTKVTAVALDAGYTIEMPVWPGYTKAPESCKAEWDRMWKALDKHEKGHAGLMVGAVVKLQLAIQAIAPGTIDEKALTPCWRNTWLKWKRRKTTTRN